MPLNRMPHVSSVSCLFAFKFDDIELACYRETRQEFCERLVQHCRQPAREFTQYVDYRSHSLFKNLTAVQGNSSLWTGAVRSPQTQTVFKIWRKESMALPYILLPRALTYSCLIHIDPKRWWWFCEYHICMDFILGWACGHDVGAMYDLDNVEIDDPSNQLVSRILIWLTLLFRCHISDYLIKWLSSLKCSVNELLKSTHLASGIYGSAHSSPPPFGLSVYNTARLSSSL